MIRTIFQGYLESSSRATEDILHIFRVVVPLAVESVGVPTIPISHKKNALSSLTVLALLLRLKEPTCHASWVQNKMTYTNHILYCV